MCKSKILEKEKCDSSTQNWNTDQISSLLSYWVARNSKFCEQGVFRIKVTESGRGGYQMQASSQVNAEPCKNRFALFFTDVERKAMGEKTSSCNRCGILVYDQEKQEIEWILINKFWSSRSILQNMLGLVQNLIQEGSGSRSPSIYETFFKSDALLLGSLYFYLRYLENCQEDRDPLIQDLETRSGTWIPSWSCYLLKSLKETAITSFRILKQPKQVHFRVTEGSQLGLQCNALDDLLHTRCGPEGRLTDSNYMKYLQYFDDFLVYLVREENTLVTQTCYAGYINLASNVEKKWAQVYSFPKSNRCLGRAMGWIVMLVHLEMGPFNLDEVGTKGDIEAQVRQLRRRHLNSPHAMALLINNDEKEVELFEPNGVTDWSHLVFDALQGYFKDAFPRDRYKWIPTQEYCPLLGIQSISKRAMCGLFSLLWIYLRLHCFKIDREQLNTNLLKGGKSLIDRLLRGLMCKVADFAQSGRQEDVDN